MPVIEVVNPGRLPRSTGEIAAQAESTLAEFLPLAITLFLAYKGYQLVNAEVPALEARISNGLTGPLTNTSITSQVQSGSLATNISSAVNPTTATTPPSSSTNTAVKTCIKGGIQYRQNPDGSWSGQAVCNPGQACPQFLTYIPAGNPAPC